MEPKTRVEEENRYVEKNAMLAKVIYARKSFQANEEKPHEKPSNPFFVFFRNQSPIITTAALLFPTLQQTSLA